MRSIWKGLGRDQHIRSTTDCRLCNAFITLEDEMVYYAYYLETKSKSLFNMIDQSSDIGPSFITGEHYENLGFINYGMLRFFLRMQQ
jgi:hypothetical protein